MKKYIQLLLALSLVLISINGFSWSPTTSTLEELVTSSEHIVQGRVTDMNSQWNKTGSLIYTEVTIAVDGIEKGPIQDETITIYMIGGRVGDIATILPGSPQFHKNEEVMLFLIETRPLFATKILGQSNPNTLGSSYQVLNIGQGKFAIRTDEDHGKVVIAPTSLGVTIDDNLEGLTSESSMPLSTFKDIIKNSDK